MQQYDYQEMLTNVQFGPLRKFCTRLLCNHDHGFVTTSALPNYIGKWDDFQKIPPENVLQDIHRELSNFEDLPSMGNKANGIKAYVTIN